MTEIEFNPNTPILIFKCRIEYKIIGRVFLALDTGASSVIISEEVLSSIGFDLQSIPPTATFGNASQSHLVPKVTLKALSLGGEKIENLTALAYTFPEDYGIDGVVGLNFLRHFKVNLDFEKGILPLEPY